MRHAMTMWAAGFSLAGLTWCVPAHGAPVERPNIVFIMADDLGPEWISAYGSEHRTPNVDRLATGGMRFTNVWATPLCTPTRHQLLTGRYPFRTGWTTHHDVPRWGDPFFDPKREITFARVLRDAGYATAVAGKWQINDFRKQQDVLRAHGFDEHCMWPGFEEGNPPAAERYWDPFIQENGKRATRTGAFGPEVFADFMIDFIRRHKDRPFLAYFPMVLTHTPFTTTPDNKDTSQSGIPLHPGMVNYVDKNVARLLDTLDELGIAERTVVVFTSDNGTVKGVRGRINGREVNGGKGTLAETGIHVPFLVRWPGRVKAGVVSDELVDFTDLFPTFAELAGGRMPEGVTIDGRSLVPVLMGAESARPRREWIFSQLGSPRVVRDKRYKLWSDGRMYDLAEDPGEERDLSGSHEPEVVAASERLRRVLDRLPSDAKRIGGTRPVKE